MPRSPLHASHEALGARFVDFAGWDMPVQYEGVLAEHKAVRNDVGIFDVSHLGRFALWGEGSTDVVQQLLCNDITEIDPGRAQYTMALNEAGAVIDDIIVWKWEKESYWIMPNGANQDRVMAAFVDASPEGVTVENRQDRTALLAVQGPNARDLIEKVVGAVPKRFGLLEAEWSGSSLWMAGTGYTGEKGGEMAVPSEVAAGLWDAFVDAGAVPCGLGSRDTLRLEMGYPLWGQDLDEETTPLEAGLEWVVGWDADFVGRPALEAQRDGGMTKRLVGFVMEGRAIPRHGCALRGGGSSGKVASGNFSPALDVGIGMGFLAPDPGSDLTSVEVEVRGTWIPARIVDLPFIEVA
jgi:aminomethyltransferase